MSAPALAHPPSARHALVLVAGNPNSGKSTVFNALSGARTRVANYPGVTIDRRSATVALTGGRAIELTDLPGTYSLAARSREEQIAVESLLGRGPRRPDAILVVADATALARALYLTIEILEIGHPVVIALNMTDEARRDGIDIDVERLEALTGARVIPTVASKGWAPMPCEPPWRRPSNGPTSRGCPTWRGPPPCKRTSPNWRASSCPSA